MKHYFLVDWDSFVSFKHSFYLNSSALNTPLLQCLEVEQIPQLYLKHKIFGYEQFLNNDLSHSVFVWLDEYFCESKIQSNRSFFHQIKKLSSKYGIEDILSTLSLLRKKLIVALPLRTRI